VDNKNVVYPESISVNARDFIDRLIRKQPTERLKAAQALEHSFLKQVSESNNDSHIWCGDLIKILYKLMDDNAKKKLAAVKKLVQEKQYQMAID
jgi:serine/threonine protein kinase